MTTAEIIAQLQQVTANLLWVSESEYPFEIVQGESGGNLTPETVIADGLKEPNSAIVTLSLADFFAPSLEIADWYGEAELAEVKRYQELYHTIATNLTDVQVFRLGSVEITVYILGKTPTGDVVGLKTMEIAT